MSRLTTLLLALFVAGLSVAVWLQAGREDPDFGRSELPLFEALDPGRVSRVRFENLERSIHLELKRDARGAWLITDPIAYPARPELVLQLLKTLQNTAWLVPEQEHERAREGLAPPRAVLEVTELLDDGREIERELSMGALDLDGMRVFVETGGRVLRTMRNLETVLENPVNEWRTRRMFELDGKAIVEIHRRGFDYSGDAVRPLRVDAQRQGATWWFDAPVRVHGDPPATSSWGLALASLAVTRFVSDVEGADLARFGLDNPWFSITLLDRKGVQQTLQFGSKGGSFFSKREDLPSIWMVAGRDLEMVFFDPRKLFDEALTRVFRREVEHVLVISEDGVLRVSQDLSEGSWSVAEADPSGEFGAPRPAHAAAVERVLSTLEQERIQDYLWEEPVGHYFAADAPRHGVFVESQGLRQGGWIAPRIESDSGARLHPFLRERESAVGLVTARVGELLELTLGDLLSRYPVLVDEVELVGLRLELGDQHRQYRRTTQGTWIYPDPDPSIQIEAKELRPVLDHLTHLKVERYLELEEQLPLAQLLSISFASRRGGPALGFALGRAEGGEVLVQRAGSQAVLSRPQLYADLLALFQ